ncbi:hypothetical protein fgpv_183 [Flamingopox virus FGPVKD09]|uniref:Virion morphogenesis protein n=1 Tax=Flamingopox virus FGPVKD09 TaxID=2059380 RepID=A0A2H4X2I6_9POXV|nr:hypothetical protein C1178_gp183 [Flamingopox virus FGPVKD09]AUD40277.1 hypothetical protein fgpv_183 [Flamingopox virus FGPVKD09]
MEKFRNTFIEFYELSKKYLENITGQKVYEVNFDNDIDSFLTVFPILESKIGCDINCTMSDEAVILAMQQVEFKMFTFWYMRSAANVKSMLNKITDKETKERFIRIFKDMLVYAKVITSINNMYSNMKKDTNEIVQDLKKILEIVSLIKSVNNEQQAYKILMDNNSFIIRTINKVLADSNYIIKIIALFNTDVVSDKIKLEEYKDVFSFSKENVIFGIKCFCDITIDGIDQINNKYVNFFKKILPNIILFQTSCVKTTQFVNIFSKLSSIVYSEILTNERLHVLFSEIMTSFKTKVSIEDLKKRKVNNIQGLIGEISNNREMYKNIFVEEYEKHKTTLISIVQCITDHYNINYKENSVDIEFIFDFIQEHYISKL